MGFDCCFVIETELHYFIPLRTGEIMYLKLFLCLLLIFPSILAGDSVKLSNVDVLTLHHGKLTKGRRSAPVPQLQCIGGSARCAFTPQVVQCYNRGSDGQDVQWECKTDMDNSYRFGLISVSCEGYSYPDDPYILKGSCGVRYIFSQQE